MFVGVVVVMDGVDGAAISGFKTYVFELVGPPPVSEIRMRTVVDAFAAGVKVNERAPTLSVQFVPLLMLYPTVVCGDGPPVSVIVQVVAVFALCQTPFA